LATLPSGPTASATRPSISLNGASIASNLFNGKEHQPRVDSSPCLHKPPSQQCRRRREFPVPLWSIVHRQRHLRTVGARDIAEVRVNARCTSPAGSDSERHIDMSTKSGTNQFHGGVYAHRGTNFLNAAPFFFKKDNNNSRHDRETAIAPLHSGWRSRGPIIKDNSLASSAIRPAHLRPGDRRRASRRAAGI